MKSSIYATIACAAALAWTSSATLAATPEEAMAKAGCTACHQKDKKVVGPSYKQIAAKHKGSNDVDALVKKARNGGSGVYGPVPMPPNPVSKISDADLKAAVEYILKQ